VMIKHNALIMDYIFYGVLLYSIPSARRLGEGYIGRDTDHQRTGQWYRRILAGSWRISQLLSSTLYGTVFIRPIYRRYPSYSHFQSIQSRVTHITG
jgi:hypothetical protein